MFDDNDIKIAGNRPSDSIKRNNLSAVSQEVLPEATLLAAKALGATVADKFSVASNAYTDAVDENDADMMTQRILLLSFTVTAVLESSLLNETIAGVAQKSFLDTVKNKYKDKIKVTISNSTIKEIVNSSNYNIFGARRIDKILDKTGFPKNWRDIIGL